MPIRAIIRAVQLVQLHRVLNEQTNPPPSTLNPQPGMQSRTAPTSQWTPQKLGMALMRIFYQTNGCEVIDIFQIFLLLCKLVAKLRFFLVASDWAHTEMYRVCWKYFIAFQSYSHFSHIGPAPLECFVVPPQRWVENYFCTGLVPIVEIYHWKRWR